jgi:peptidoglycan/xylan/chitin deacetylase (PgdA/CDA1 family)
MNKLLKYLWAFLWYHSRLVEMYLWIRDSISGANHSVILMYHRVVPHEISHRIFSLSEIVVYQETFEKQMLFLSNHYHVISLDDFINAKKYKKDIPPKTAVITFDDGWEDTYLYAFPVLNKFNLPATIFLTTGFIGTDRIFWQEKIIFLTDRLLTVPGILKDCFLSNNLVDFGPLIDNLVTGVNISETRLALITRLKQAEEAVIEGLIDSLTSACGYSEFLSRENSFLNWQQIDEMKGSLISFGSHGINHRLLDMCTEDVIKEEMRLSKDMIEDKSGMPVRNFAYPNGNYNEKITGLLKKSDYSSGVTVEEGLNTLNTDSYRLRRINICEGRFLGPKGHFSKERFAAYLAGLL